jgi:hypothetical protein
MTEFDKLKEAARILERAEVAYGALTWAQETKRIPGMNQREAFSYGIQRGSATPQGQNAKPYFQAAFVHALPQILEHMIQLANEDITKARELLK